MQNKNNTIDIAKGIAIILVVYGHVIEHSMAPWGNQDFFLNPVFKAIYTFHMPLFVFLSGYLIAFSLKRRGCREVFRSRCQSLFVPFLMLGVLGILMTYFLNMVFGNIARVDFAEDLAGQLLLKPSVWFLFTLFILSSLLICSVKLEQRFGAFVFAAVYFLLMMVPFNNYCALYYIKWFYPFYLAGYFFNRRGIKVSKAGIKAMVLIVALVLFLWLSVYWTKFDYIYVNKMNLVPDQYISGFLRLMYRYFMGLLGILVTLYFSAFLSKTKMAAVLSGIGAYSLDIYILQMFLLEGLYPRCIYKYNIHLDLNSPAVLYILAPLISACFVSACMLISKLLIRKSALLNKLLLGGRA